MTRGHKAGEYNFERKMDMERKENLLNGEKQSETCRKDLHMDITRILTALCFTPKYSGYDYVREAIKLAVEQGDRCCGISKSIYPTVAKLSHTTNSAVESGIRTAIRRAWMRTDDSVKIELFGTYALCEGWIPTNSEFIFVLADRLVCNSYK